MGNETRWYTTREAVKAAGGIKGAALDRQVDQLIEAASSEIEGQLQQIFIPEIATRSFDYPPRRRSGDFAYFPWVIDLPALLEATLVTKDGDEETTIPSSDYYLLPYDQLPKREIEINLTTGAYFGPGPSSAGGFQKAVRITGEWGYSRNTRSAGVLDAAIASAGALTLDVQDASLVGIGDTLRIDNERLFVRGRQLVDTTATLTGAIAGDDRVRTLPLSSGALLHAGEIVTIGAERFLIESIAGNDATALRQYDGSVLEGHANGAAIWAPRRLEVVRGIAGSTAATHADAAAISVYAPEADIVKLCIANVLMSHEFGKTGWTSRYGGGEGAQEMSGRQAYFLCEAAKKKYLEAVVGGAGGTTG